MPKIWRYHEHFHLVVLALVTLVTFGINAFFGKLAVTNQVYVPSFMTVTNSGLVG